MKLSPAQRVADIMHKAAIRAEALKIVLDVRSQTVEICAKAIESLYLDSQGLILDANTIEACAAIVRNLDRASTQNGEEG